MLMLAPAQCIGLGLETTPFSPGGHIAMNSNVGHPIQFGTFFDLRFKLHQLIDSISRLQETTTGL